jgi:hypothetical protein
VEESYKKEIIWGKIKIQKKNLVFGVLLKNGKEIDVSVSREVMGCLQVIRLNDLVKVRVFPSPKMAKIIALVRKLPIVWNEELVGYMQNPDVEDCYWFGKWVALNKLQTTLFINEIRNNKQVIVDLGSIKGYVSAEPIDSIQVEAYLDLQLPDIKVVVQ